MTSGVGGPAYTSDTKRRKLDSVVSCRICSVFSFVIRMKCFFFYLLVNIKKFGLHVKAYSIPPFFDSTAHAKKI